MVIFSFQFLSSFTSILHVKFFFRYDFSPLSRHVVYIFLLHMDFAYWIVKSVNTIHRRWHTYFFCVIASTMYQYFVKVVPTVYKKLGGGVCIFQNLFLQIHHSG